MSDSIRCSRRLLLLYAQQQGKVGRASLLQAFPFASWAAIPNGPCTGSLQPLQRRDVKRLSQAPCSACTRTRLIHPLVTVSSRSIAMTSVRRASEVSGLQKECCTRAEYCLRVSSQRLASSSHHRSRAREELTILEAPPFRRRAHYSRIPL